MPQICVQSLELHAGCLVIVTVWHSMNHNHESCICQLWMVTSRFFAHALCQICHQSLVASPPLLPGLSNVTCTFLQKHLHPCFLPLVERTTVRLPHPFGKLLEGEFRLLQADWGFAFSPAHVRQIIALIICIELVQSNLW